MGLGLLSEFSLLPLCNCKGGGGKGKTEEGGGGGRGRREIREEQRRRRGGRREEEKMEEERRRDGKRKGGEGEVFHVSCFYSFGEPLKTWTYAMLTCIAYHVILLYS